MDKNSWNLQFRERTIHVFLAVTVCFLFVVGRQVWLQCYQHDYYLEQGIKYQKSQEVVRTIRGDIRDRNGEPLATSTRSRSIAFRPNEIVDRLATAQTLARILNKPADRILTRLMTGSGYDYVARKAPDAAVEEILRLKSNPTGDENFVDPLPGIEIENEYTGQRFYPKGRLASHVLGGAGVDEQGLGGIEASYDRRLAGRLGLVVRSIDVGGMSIPTDPIVKQEPVDGCHVVLTIDETIQYIVEAELAKQVKDYHAKGGICIVMNAKTAEVLAMAVNPDFVPNDFTTPDSIRKNRAVTDSYEPGSTFKVFLAGAALAAGVQPSDSFYCPGTLMIDGWPVSNANDGLSAGGSETLADILAFSFNTGTASVAMSIGRDKLGQGLERFGFGKPTGVGLQGEEYGLLADYHNWAKINTATISFGQGVSATPIQLVSAMQSVTNDGIRMQPSIVKSVLKPNGQIFSKTEPRQLCRTLTSKQAAQLREMLTGVVTYGTGKAARVPGYLVAGKTGTAQVVSKNGGYADGRYIAGFLGFAPVEDPEIVVLVKIEEPTPVYWGGVVAGPVFSNICKKVLPYLQITPKPGFEQRGPNG